MSNAAPAVRSRTVAGALFLLAAVFIAYSPALRAGFVWDDDDHLTNNAHVRDAASPLAIWTRPTPHPQYFPLTWTTFWIEHRLWGFRPQGYHAVNILLHGLNAILLWALLRRWRLPGAFFAASFFALHPVEVESVAWVTERKNVLAGLFTLLSLLAFTRSRGLDASGEGPSRDVRPASYALALLGFLLALFSKTSVVALPFVLVALTWWRTGSVRARDVALALPFAAASVVMGLITLRWEFPETGAAEPGAVLGLLQRIQIAGRAFWFYPAKILFPTGLTFVYPRWAIPDSVSPNLLFAAAAAAVVVALWIARARIGRGPLTAVLAYALMVGPLLGLKEYYYQRYSFVADHHQYLAGIAILVLLAQGLGISAGRLRLGRLPRRAAAAVVVAALGTMTFAQAGMYKDAETLWRRTIGRNPSCSIAHNNLGGILALRGERGAAAAHFRKAVELDPHNYEAWVNLGNALFQEHDLAGAGDAYRRAIAVQPALAEARVDLGNVERLEGRLDAAIEHFRGAVQADAGSRLAHGNLVLALRDSGRTEDALNAAGGALAAFPGDAGFRRQYAQMAVSRGLELVARGDKSAAIDCFRKALTYEPDRLLILNNLAWLVATNPDPAIRAPDEAMRLAEHMVDLTSRRDANALDTLGVACAAAGRYEEAAAAAEEALALLSTNHPALSTRIAARLETYRANNPWLE